VEIKAESTTILLIKDLLLYSPSAFFVLSRERLNQVKLLPPSSLSGSILLLLVIVFFF
jgi:hypothetical protein